MATTGTARGKKSQGRQTAIPIADLFDSFNTFAGSGGTMQAVSGTPQKSGSSSRCDYTICKDYESLTKALSVSVSAGDSSGDDSVSAKAKFVNQLNYTTYSVAIVVYANIVTDSVSGTNVQLTQPAPTPVNLNAFFQTCGDSFVSSIVKGGEYMGVYMFYSQSEEDRQSLQASFDANGLTEAGALSLGVQLSLDLITQQVTTRQMFNQLITGISAPTYPTSGQMIQYALSFGASKIDSPAVISYGTTGYEQVQGMSQSVWKPIVKNRTLYQAPGTAGLAGCIESIGQVMTQAEWIQQVYKTYRYAGDPQLSSNYKQIVTDWQSANGLLAEMNTDPTQAYKLPSFPSLAFGAPSLNFVLTNFSKSNPGPWGGNGGNPFQDVTRSSVLSQTTLSQIMIQGNQWVDNLTVTYNSNTGTNTFTRGGNGGSAGNPLQLQAGEFVATISGWAGDYINQLSFETTMGGTLIGPPNPQGANPFLPWTPPQGSVLLGFEGRCGDFLDQLAPVVCTFSPTEWS